MTNSNRLVSEEDPIAISRKWLMEAEQLELNDPNAMALATCDVSGMPNVRILLLKQILPDGYVFFSNYESKKANEISQNEKAAFVIHWKSLRKQIRVRGTVSKLDKGSSDAYYQTRSINSRIGVWASKQSEPLNSRAYLEKRVEEFTNLKGDKPNRPPYWGGYKLTPFEIEFWSEGLDRLHERVLYQRESIKVEWSSGLLFP